MRGKAHSVCTYFHRLRITPAYAGKRNWLAMQLGEKRGITPAYAGKSMRGHRKIFRRRDHPRLCGEKDTPYIITSTRYRITPAYAGKSLFLPRGAGLVLRITPAYAGKSLPSLPPACKAEDHPRLCGEKNAFTVYVICKIGSPPPMRGKADLHQL